MTDDESEVETATGNDDGNSSAKRKLRNRRLNLNKLSRDVVFNGVHIIGFVLHIQGDPNLVCELSEALILV